MRLGLAHAVYLRCMYKYVRTCVRYVYVCPDVYVYVRGYGCRYIYSTVILVYSRGSWTSYQL